MQLYKENSIFNLYIKLKSLLIYVYFVDSLQMFFRVQYQTKLRKLIFYLKNIYTTNNLVSLDFLKKPTIFAKIQIFNNRIYTQHKNTKDPKVLILLQ
jgi:hypothetical protein